MCLGAPKPPRDDSAEKARAEEAARQARITEGQGKIDENFKLFDDSYFDKYRQDYTNYYTPQLADQAAKAREKTVFGIARSGNIDSSAGADQLADFERKRGNEQARIGASAMDAVNQLRSSVEQNKTDLYNINRSSADPSSAAAQAAARAANLSAAPAYSPLGDVFADIINQGGLSLSLEGRGYPGMNTGLFNSSTASSGSGRVVR